MADRRTRSPMPSAPFCLSRNVCHVAGTCATTSSWPSSLALRTWTAGSTISRSMATSGWPTLMQAPNTLYTTPSLLFDRDGMGAGMTGQWLYTHHAGQHQSVLCRCLHQFPSPPRSNIKLKTPGSPLFIREGAARGSQRPLPRARACQDFMSEQIASILERTGRQRIQRQRPLLRMFDKVRQRISYTPLSLMTAQCQRAKSWETDADNNPECTGRFYKSHGLLCAHHFAGSLGRWYRSLRQLVIDGC